MLDLTHLLNSLAYFDLLNLLAWFTCLPFSEFGISSILFSPARQWVFLERFEQYLTRPRNKICHVVWRQTDFQVKVNKEFYPGFFGAQIFLCMFIIISYVMVLQLSHFLSSTSETSSQTLLIGGLACFSVRQLFSVWTMI